MYELLREGSGRWEKIRLHEAHSLIHAAVHAQSDPSMWEKIDHGETVKVAGGLMRRPVIAPTGSGAYR